MLAGALAMGAARAALPGAAGWIVGGVAALACGVVARLIGSRLERL